MLKTITYGNSGENLAEVAGNVDVDINCISIYTKPTLLGSLLCITNFANMLGCVGYAFSWHEKYHQVDAKVCIRLFKSDLII